MPAFPLPDAPDRAGWDAVEKTLAAAREKRRSEALAAIGKSTAKTLRIKTVRPRSGPAFFDVVSVSRLGKKRSIISRLTFIHKSDAEGFIRTAQSKKGKTI